MIIKYPRNRSFIFKTIIFVVLVIIFINLINKTHDYMTMTANESAQLRISKTNKYEVLLERYESRIIPNLGHDGFEAHLDDPEEQRLGEESLKKFALNAVLSDRMPLNREIRDVRFPGCKQINYNPTLKASVVIVFHNEVLSIILRTIWSVILQTPKRLLHEIVLIDDASTEEELKGLLSFYINTRLKNYNIKLHELNQRGGLTKAKLEGARVSTGDVLIFLDAHSEATKGWIEPLLSRIEEDRSAVLVPLIDIISADKMAYLTTDSTWFQVGGFSWSGHFTWINIQDENDKGKITPVKSPTMAGGLLAIEREYFWEVGSYDDQMEGWGGENLEMSFRIWQCGGRIETVPCSRVGHIFRNFHPYKIPGNKNTHGINTARLVNVWMDDYKRLFYMHAPDLKDSSLIGDLTSRIELRKRLKCKSFKWYLDNVYPEKFIPDENVVAYGQGRNNRNMCFDNLQLKKGSTGPLGLYSCHPYIAVSQFFSVTYKGELRSEDFCAEVDNNHEVKLTTCSKHKPEQAWVYFSNGTIYSSFLRMCLSSKSVGVATGLKVEKCEKSDHHKWTFTFHNSTYV